MIVILSIVVLLLCIHLPSGSCFCALQYCTTTSTGATIVETQITPGQRSQHPKHTLSCNNEKIGLEPDCWNSRRRWIQTTIVAAGWGLAPPNGSATAHELATNADVLPRTLRDYTKLAPLGPKQSTNSIQSKSTHLPPEDIAQRLAHDLLYGSTNRGGYFLTGDLSKDLFLDNCVFEDPTNRVNSLDQYQTALTLLFDPEASTVELLDDGLQVRRDRCIDHEDGHCVVTIVGRIRSRGYLKVAPWRPYVKAYETTIVYTIDPSTGLIARQDQTWTKGASEALRETFTPTVFVPPKSSLPKPEDEPKLITQLFQKLNGRRPTEYSHEERIEIDRWLQQVAALDVPKPTSSVGLTGTWVLVYLQEGPDGAGIDRRIPFFPEFDFNDSFQVFFSSTSEGGRVTNIGQVLGSLADVRVSGTLKELANDDETATTNERKRFEANIQGGRLCFRAPLPSQQDADNAAATATANCPIDLPMIRGKGLFESIYLGERLRIGQNLNGGGARVVQIRIE